MQAETGCVALLPSKGEIAGGGEALHQHPRADSRWEGEGNLPSWLTVMARTAAIANRSG